MVCWLDWDCKSNTIDNKIKALSLELAFAYGSLISATDPVSVIGALKLLNIDKMLNILIFGESILNDAVALICF